MITYVATNTENGKFYIGSTNDLDRRKKEHLKCKSNYPFQNALRKNQESFVWEVYEDDSEAPVLEQALLDMWFGKEQCYNLCPEASRPPASTKGKHWWFNPELCQECCSDNCPGEGWNEGRNPQSTESAHEASVGRTVTPENRAKLRDAHTGKKRSTETISKMVQSWKGKKWWVNSEGGTCRSVSCPGEGWFPGRFTSF